MDVTEVTERPSLALLLALLLVQLGALACGEPERAGTTAGGSATQDAPGPSAEAREPAPEFTLLDLEGRRVSLVGLRGQVVVLDFWATWCAPCIHQIPVLNEFAATHRGDAVRVLGVAVDAEGRDTVAPFAREHEIAYTILIGDESLATRYRAIGYPSLYVIDAQGAIVSTHVGVITLEELEEAVAQAAGAETAQAITL